MEKIMTADDCIKKIVNSISDMLKEAQLFADRASSESGRERRKYAADSILWLQASVSNIVLAYMLKVPFPNDTSL
jgi:hypothetical protein